MHHYHAIILTTDSDGQNQRVTLEAETIDRAKELFAAKYGADAVFKVWMDDLENRFLGYSE